MNTDEDIIKQTNITKMSNDIELNWWIQYAGLFG